MLSECEREPRHTEILMRNRKSGEAVVYARQMTNGIIMCDFIAQTIKFILKRKKKHKRGEREREMWWNVGAGAACDEWKSRH